MGTVDIRRSTLASADAVGLIAALNAELTATFPEPGANHFSLTGAQVETQEGANRSAYYLRRIFPDADRGVRAASTAQCRDRPGSVRQDLAPAPTSASAPAVGVHPRV